MRDFAPARAAEAFTGEFRRCAVYFAPRPASALGQFGAAWLGWDAERAADCAGLELAGLPRPRAELVAAPRRYGFHATLKAPFRLAEAATSEGLDKAVEELAAEHAPFKFRVELRAIDAFLALTPEDRVGSLDAIAADCVTRLDGFRAPLGAEEIARRKATGLSRREEEHLARWGYPHVLDRFQFHLTLTGALSPEDQQATGDVLEETLAPILAEPMGFEDLCLFGEAADGRFRVVRRHRLGAEART